VRGKSIRSILCWQLTSLKSFSIRGTQTSRLAKNLTSCWLWIMIAVYNRDIVVRLHIYCRARGPTHAKASNRPPYGHHIAGLIRPGQRLVRWLIDHSKGKADPPVQLFVQYLQTRPQSMTLGLRAVTVITIYGNRMSATVTVPYALWKVDLRYVYGTVAQNYGRMKTAGYGRIRRYGCMSL